MFDGVPKFSGGLEIGQRSDDRAGGASSMTRSVRRAREDNARSRAAGSAPCSAFCRRPYRAGGAGRKSFLILQKLLRAEANGEGIGLLQGRVVSPMASVPDDCDAANDASIPKVDTHYTTRSILYLRDLHDVARETLVGADQCAVFDVLFEAATRAIRYVPRIDVKLNATLNDALDRIYAELTRTEPTQTASFPEVNRTRAGGGSPKRPALHP